MNKGLLCALALTWTVMGACTTKSNEAIVDVKSYGFVDLEGAKVSAIIVEYDQEIKGSSVDASKYSIRQINRNLYAKTFNVIGDIVPSPDCR